MKMKEPRLVSLPKIGNDEIGYISVAEKLNLPFDAKRVYWTYHTPENIERGGHAHLDLEQLLVALSGTILLHIETIDGKTFEFVLDTPDKGVLIPKLSWRTMKYSKNAIQMCIASIAYDEKDYIRDYHDFEKLKLTYDTSVS